MNDKESETLQNPDNWNWEAAESKRGKRKHRAVVSVAFVREDFEQIALYAESIGQSVSALIREAVLEKVTGAGALVTFSYTVTTPQQPFVSRIGPRAITAARVSKNPLTSTK
jgi:hypothetical protein